MGLHKALVERKIKVILIEHTPISNFDFLPKSLELLSSSQVLRWKGEKSLPLNSRFWKKLRCIMPAKPGLRNTAAAARPVRSATECEQLMQSTRCSGFPSGDHRTSFLWARWLSFGQGCLWELEGHCKGFRWCISKQVVRLQVQRRTSYLLFMDRFHTNTHTFFLWCHVIESMCYLSFKKCTVCSWEINVHGD